MKDDKQQDVELSPMAKMVMWSILMIVGLGIVALVQHFVSLDLSPCNIAIGLIWFFPMVWWLFQELDGMLPK